ncbi:MAG: ferredoxin [Roseburia sp.]
MKAKVNDGCISCGACVELCPEVFRFGDEGTSEAYQDVTKECEESAKEARDACPVSVIDIEES